MLVVITETLSYTELRIFSPSPISWVRYNNQRYLHLLYSSSNKIQPKRFTSFTTSYKYMAPSPTHLWRQYVLQYLLNNPLLLAITILITDPDASHRDFRGREDNACGSSWRGFNRKSDVLSIPKSSAVLRS